MTIEHLAAQSDGVKNGGRIGNLIYVTEALNTKLDSKGWDAKRTLMKATQDQWIPGEVKNASTWSTRSIRDRTKALAELGRTKIWKG